jgi:hypothetical protein
MKVIPLVLFFGCAIVCRAESDICFLPAAPRATVSFEGVTQDGKSMHRLEVRRLSYFHPTLKKMVPSDRSYVIYYAGEGYGPVVLHTFEAIEPLVRKVTQDVVEIYFTAGAHTHLRQKWKLLGGTAKLEKEEEISWRDDPR